MRKFLLIAVFLTVGLLCFGQDPNEYLAKLKKKQLKGDNENATCYFYYKNIYSGEINSEEKVEKLDLYNQSAFVLGRIGGGELSQYYFMDYEVHKTIIEDIGRAHV